MTTFPNFISSCRYTPLFLFVILCGWIFSTYLLNSSWNIPTSSLSDEIPFKMEDSSYPRNSSNDTTEWTVMAYLDGDNNLEYGTLDILNELEAGYIPNQGVEIVALLDRNPEYDFSNDDWSNARYYHVVADSEPFLISSELCQNLGEINMGNPTRLREFVIWAQTEFPAQHYALLLYDHGLSLRGVCIDDSSFHDFLSIDEVQQGLSGLHIDLLSVDGCAMAILEVAYEWATFTDYIVFSQNMIMIEGMDYNASIHSLCFSPSLPPWEFGNILAHTALDYYQWDWDLTYSVINCSRISTLSNALSDLGLHLTEFLTNDTNLAISSLRRTLEYTIDEGKNYFVDLGSMIQLFSTFFQNSTDLNDTLTVLKEIYDETIYANIHHKFAPNATGLLIVFPKDAEIPALFHEYYSTIKDELANLDILNDPAYLWDNFLATYVSSAPIIPSPDYPVESISIGDTRPFKINASIPFHDFHFQVEVGHIYEISISVSSGDVGVVVIGESSISLPPRGYLYSNAQNPEQTTYEQIIYWFDPGFYVIALSCWSIFSSFGNTHGNVSIHLCEPSQIEPDSTVTGTFPPLRTGTAPILPIYSYYLLDLQPEDYSFTINATPGVSLFVNLWKGLHTTQIDTFLGQRNEIYTFEYHAMEAQQILIEISAYEGSGEYCMKIISKTNPFPLSIPAIIGIGSGGILLILSLIGIVIWKRRK